MGALDINEFSEIYPEWVWQYWLATGDRSLLEAVYPTIANLSDYVQSAVAPSTGLVTSLPATNVYYAFPVVTRLNVLGVDVFRRAADVATALGRPTAEISRQQDRQSELTTAINARLTRPDGIYVDGLLASGKQTKEATQESNTAAVAYDVVPVSREAHVAAYIAARGMTNPPRTAAEVLAALRLTGRDRDFVQRITDPKAPGWANILARGATFTWEVWNPSDAIGDSMSHGWGANVLVEIRRELLGIDPTGPGYVTFDVTPPRGGLASASGRVPTPRGSIVVAWQPREPARDLDPRPHRPGQRHRHRSTRTAPPTQHPEPKAANRGPGTSGFRRVGPRAHPHHRPGRAGAPPGSRPKGHQCDWRRRVPPP